ncbi:metal-dependent hydrolase [Paenibacillus turpanensis]|uniref:metal-dependent hydrolase n=1 Tax=Paenibacillus turpanensis TaxID=2689078 RepID=UPI00140AD798|nr:metal-dependent hydrolase [Paenibacillus turpanensis]
MDTGSHLLFGATLAGLACVDAAVAGSGALFAAVLTGTLIGSHAPDFDTFARLRGMEAYIRTHRGITHSLPALFLWALVIGLPVAFGYGVMNEFWHVYGWTLVAVVLHVFLDLCNAYGVQCLRPFTRKWLHLDVLSLHEPFFLVIHAGALGWWLWSGKAQAALFITLYAITFAYIALQYLHRQRLLRKVRRALGLRGVYHLLPTLHWFHWQFVLETDDAFHTGFIQYGRVNRVEVLAKGERNPVIEATLQLDGVRTFFYFAKRIHCVCTEASDGYVVKWRDVRFWHNGRLPFGVDVKLDRNLNVVESQLGWNKKAWQGPYV